MALTLATTIFVTSLVQLVLFLKLLFVFFGAANAKVNGGERAPEDTYQKQCAEGQEASAGWVAKKALVDRFFRMTINGTLQHTCILLLLVLSCWAAPTRIARVLVSHPTRTLVL